MELHASYSPPLTVVPSPTIVDFGTTTASCVVNTEMVTASLSGSLGPVLGLVGMSCEGGTATGRGTFSSTATGFPTMNVAIEAVAAGGTITVDFSWNTWVLHGVGTFQQRQADTQSCLAGTPVGSTTWNGVMVFEDPTLPTP